MEVKQRRSAMNVLVVEDSRTQAEFIRQILETAGYNVILAGNGAEAIKQVETARPDIVLTDILMPGIDGYELCRRIKQQNPNLPVIMVTVLFDPADVLKGLAAGADSFIVKPPNPEHVCSQIEAVMRGREMAGATEDSEELEIPFNGSTYTIKAGKLQIVNTLLSTYTIAVAKNAELHKVQSQLRSLNSQLRRALDEISLSNENLAEENLTRRRAEKALAEASRKLQLMASITRHDLLNQLSVLWGHLDLALALRDTDQANAWRHVENAVEMVKRINNTLQFTAEYQRIGTSSPAWQEIRSLVEAAAGCVSLGTVSLENNIPPGVEVFADPLIERVFTNLIDNALRHGEKVTRISFGLKRGGDSCVIFCEDDGVGVPVDEKEKIFSYAYGKNTGLGLFLAREILSITGITIRETGNPGEGARFEMICPPDMIRAPVSQTG